MYSDGDTVSGVKWRTGWNVSRRVFHRCQYGDCSTVLSIRYCVPGGIEEKE
jgi:hypothetical protein